jgi:putative transposase
MTHSNVVELKSPTTDALGELLKRGAQQLLVQAIEVELAELLARYGDVKVDGKQAVVRNGHLPGRTIQTGLGEISVKVPRDTDTDFPGARYPGFRSYRQPDTPALRS